MKTTKIFDVTEKARIYHTLAQMSSSFSSIIRYCADLEQVGALTPRAKNRFQAFTIEVQGELNLEILDLSVRAADLRVAITKQLLAVASCGEYQLWASAPMPMFRARKRKNSQQHAHMEGIEMEDWARGGRVREKWEKYLRNGRSHPARRRPKKHKDPGLNRELGRMLR